MITAAEAKALTDNKVKLLTIINEYVVEAASKCKYNVFIDDKEFVKLFLPCHDYMIKYLNGIGYKAWFSGMSNYLTISWDEEYVLSEEEKSAIEKEVERKLASLKITAK